MPLLRAKIFRAAVLVAGLFAGQLILFGPSLAGRKLLLPVDVLSQPLVYLSPAQSAAWGPPQDPVLTDPINEGEPDRQFAVAQVRAGRVPLWNPHEFCGQPFVAANQTAVFSPFRLLDYLWPAPTVIAWDQVLKTFVAGIGAYLFFRAALGVRFLPALFGAWLWPLCGYYIQCGPFTVSAAAAWLPWIFLCTDRALCNPSLPWGAGLAIVTAVCLLSGHAATAAQVLLADGLFFCWRVVDLHGYRIFRAKASIAGIVSVLLGWILGAILSAPQSWPTIEYLHSSYRMAARAALGSETPTVGLPALPQLVLPDFNGATRRGHVYFGGSLNLVESASTGYVGLITALVFAPLCFCSRKHRSIVLFSLLLGICGMGQILGLPLLKQLYDSYPLKLLRENRLALWTGWSIAIMGVIGLEAIQPNLPRRLWFWIAAAIPLVLGLYCLERAYYFPAALVQILAAEPKFLVDQLSHSFSATSLGEFGLCIAAFVIWLAIIGGIYRYRWFVCIIGLLAVSEVIVTDFGVYPQCDPAQYFPRQPILVDLANAPAGRVCGVRCFPACITQTQGLYDIRGYDGATPQRLVELLFISQPALLWNDPDQSNVLRGYYPRDVQSPIASMLNLRYIILPGTPPAGAHPRFVSDGYWVYENPQFLPRVFLPRHVQVVDDSQRRLKMLSQPDFNPTDIAYVESPGTNLDQPAQGQAKISRELPSHITIDYEMPTPGLIVLSDLWDPGWHATINGVDVPVLRVNHAVRGVMAPKGKGVLQYDYAPRSFFLGLKLSAASAAALLVWIALTCLPLRKNVHLYRS